MRYPTLCSRMIASDTKLRTDNMSMLNQKKLKRSGVIVGVLDARNLPRSKDYLVAAVYFNCPMGSNHSQIPQVVNNVLKWSKRRLLSNGTLHFSCHGNQRNALKGMNLPQAAKSCGLVLYNMNSTLQQRFPGYIPTRTSGTLMNNSPGRVHEYIYCAYGEKGVDYTIDMNGVYSNVNVRALPVAHQRRWKRQR
jgi:hypothetical protein